MDGELVTGQRSNEDLKQGSNNDCDGKKGAARMRYNHHMRFKSFSFFASPCGRKNRRFEGRKELLKREEKFEHC